jgi:hypothetical protein
MSRRTPTILDDLFPDTAPEFAAIADTWPKEVIVEMLTLVWDGFDNLKTSPNFKSLDFSKDYAQLERSLTDLHQIEITALWGKRRSGFESFVPHHEPWEFENLTDRSARPPSGDIGFVLLSNRRLRWSVEAKVLKSPTDTARYLGDLDKFLDGKCSPLATEGALGGYLLTGKSEDFLNSLQIEIKVTLKRSAEFPTRPHRTSEHLRDKRKLPPQTPPQFVCHHMPFSLN